MTTTNTPGLCLDSGEFIPASELAAGSPLAAGQATAAQAVVPPNAITASIMRDDGGEAPAFCLMAAYRSEKDAMDAFALIAAAPARDLAAVIKGAADKLDAAVRCHPNAVDTLIHEALEILDGDREPDAASHGQAYPTIDDLCARIKAADDAAADRDYMLDSNDCIAVLRGEWEGALTMDKPERASHGQAQAHEGPQAASLAEAVRDVGKWLNERPNRPLDLRSVAMLCAHAQQADSVQEDAARLDYLHSTGSTIEMLPGEVDFYPMRFRVGGLHSAVSPNLREAIDIARKQGGA